VAATLTADGDLLYASFPIEKIETDADGDLVVYGKASDAGLDSDNQIVDPQWMAKASQEWLATGANVRVQHNPQRDPAGIGIKAETDATGATWVTAKVIEPVAQKLVSKGALRAYSVGIARPTIVRDGSAPNGRITNGELVEISLVDRPANKRCQFQLAKSADGAPEYTGELFGEDEDIQKALGADVEKGAYGIPQVEGNKNLEFSMPEDMSFTFTPNDLANILKNKFVEQHYDELAKTALYDAENEVYKRDINTATRRGLASQGHALPDGSYPIANSEDLHNAAVLARSGHGNVSGARALIARRAKELGVANPLSDTDDNKQAVKNLMDDPEWVADVEKRGGVIENGVMTKMPDAPKEAEPVVTKDPEGDKADTPPKKGKKGKKLPPWLNKPDADGKTDNDGDADDKSATTDAEKCSPSGTPQSASGAKDAPPMKEIPNKGPAPESPMPAGRKTPDTKSDEPELHASPEMAAMLRFKTVGIDIDLGRLHDLSCPAFHPDEVSKYHPFADFKSVIDENLFRHKALDAAAGKSLQEAMEMQEVWQASRTLKNIDEGLLNTIRLELHKAFRDANPGPTSYPSPGCVSPGKYNRPVISGGHAANSPGYGSPNSSPSAASGPVGGAGQFDRPPLGSGHQTPSPGFMKTDWEVPSETGVPTRLTYAHMEKEQALSAIGRMHTHLMAMVPNVCPMNMNSRGPLDPNPATGAVGVGKNEEAEVEKTEAVFKAPVETDDGFYAEFLAKAFKKTRKKLGKKVLSGKMTVDEARGKLGRMNTQKDAAVELEKGMKEAAVELVEDGVLSIDDARKHFGLPAMEAKPEPVEKSAEPVNQYQWGFDYIQKTYGPDVVKSAVMEAITPLQEMLTAQREVFEGKIAEQQKVIDAIANSPDPRGEPFSGMALNMHKSARPAGVPDVAEAAERTQQMLLRQLNHTFNTTEDPAEREAAWNAMQKFRGV
jgi:hypothetical protein